MNAELMEDVAAMTATAKRFAEVEIAPHINAWDEAGSFPRALYGKAAHIGLLGLGYPEALGGMPAPFALRSGKFLLPVGGIASYPPGYSAPTG